MSSLGISTTTPTKFIGVVSDDPNACSATCRQGIDPNRRPRSERQLDPRVHPELIRLLADGHTAGFGEEFVTFDEEDALTRAARGGNQYFAACADPTREFAAPLLARSYLDV
jgi:hypothetical protein